MKTKKLALFGVVIGTGIGAAIALRKKVGPAPAPQEGPATTPPGGLPAHYTSKTGLKFKCKPTETRRTKLPAILAADYIQYAYQQKYGRTLSPSALAILVGMWAHETRKGQAMWNWNFGNVRANTAYTGSCQAMKAHEYTKSGEKYYSYDPFRAYEGPREGAHAFVTLLNWTRYKSCRAPLEAGNSSGFINCLKNHGYFTGSASKYAASVASLAQSYRRGALV